MKRSEALRAREVDWWSGRELGKLDLIIWAGQEMRHFVLKSLTLKESN